MGKQAATSIHTSPKAATELARNIRIDDDLDYLSQLRHLQQPMTWLIKDELVNSHGLQPCAQQLPSPIDQASRRKPCTLWPTIPVELPGTSSKETGLEQSAGLNRHPLEHYPTTAEQILLSNVHGTFSGMPNSEAKSNCQWVTYTLQLNPVTEPR